MVFSSRFGILEGRDFLSNLKISGITKVREAMK